jgi:hypothetical protein
VDNYKIVEILTFSIWNVQCGPLRVANNGNLQCARGVLVAEEVGKNCQSYQCFQGN